MEIAYFDTGVDLYKTKYGTTLSPEAIFIHF